MQLTLANQNQELTVDNQCSMINAPTLPIVTPAKETETRQQISGSVGPAI